MFQRRAVAAAELRHVLPRELIRRLDLRTLRAVPPGLVDQRLGLREGDLLFVVRNRLTRRDVYLLFEHQSRADRFMAFRILRSVVLIWERLLEHAPRLRRLPIVIRIVLHHGRRLWSAPRDLASLIDLDSVPPGAIAAHLPSLRLLVDDVARVPDRALLDRSGPPLLVAALAVLARASTMKNVDHALGPFRKALQAVARSPSVAAHNRLWHYVFAVSSVPREAVLAFIQSLTPEAKNAMPTVAEQLIQMGHKEGRVEGRVEGQIRLLLKQLRLRFGPLPAAMAARVAAGTPADVERWAGRVITAPTLSAVLARGRSGAKKARRKG